MEGRLLFDELTDSQKKIVGLHGKNILKACPGSGKTFVVAHKVVNDFNLWQEKNKGMAILSFTNIAKRELDTKIQEISGLNTLPYPHFIGTLDSFVSQYIFMPFGQVVMKCSNRPSIIEDDYLLQFSKFFWKKECYANGCNPKDFYINTDMTIYDTKRDFSNCPFTSNEPCVKLKVKTYSKGYATYKEALIIAIHILKNNSNIRSLIVNRFPYFIVDEAQDTSEEQMELLNLLFNNGVKNAMLIGDPDQAIYEWRDADPSVFLNMYNSKSWNSKELNENFRCSQQICNATKIFSSLSQTSIAKGSTKEFFTKPTVIKYGKGNNDALIQKFLNLCKKNNINISQNNVAVLVRGRSGLTGKDYSVIKDLWQTPITLLFAQATFYKGIQNVEKAASTIEKVLYMVIFDNQSNNIDFNKVQDEYSIVEWNRLVYKLSSLLPDSTLSLKRWKLVIHSLFKEFILSNNIKCKYDIEIKTKNRVKDNNLKDFSEQPIETFFANAYEREYLNTTIHSVKGCTFDAVMLIINTHGKLTSNMINKKPIDSEEIRTFYVAATRARKLFVLAIPDTITDKSLVRFPTQYWDYI